MNRQIRVALTFGYTIYDTISPVSSPVLVDCLSSACTKESVTGKLPEGRSSFPALDTDLRMVPVLSVCRYRYSEAIIASVEEDQTARGEHVTIRH